MNTREQFEAAWRKEYPLHSSTAFTRSGFDPERYANTRVQDGWLMWQAARATPSADAVDRNAVRASCSTQTVFSAAQWTWIRHELKQAALSPKGDRND